MCWNLGASGIFAIVGFIAAAYLARKKESRFLWIPLVYFGLMELLQAVSYFYLGACLSSENKTLTLLSYLHIAFQPIFINALVMYFIPAPVRKKLFWPVIILASFVTLMMIVKLYPFAGAGMCTPGTTLCGEQLCSFKGNWHLAWSIPLNGFGLDAMTYYYLAVFVLPLVYGSWKTTLYSLVFGPLLAMSLTNNPNEWPAIWCLISIAVILGGAVPWLRKVVRVKKWYFWEYPRLVR